MNTNDADKMLALQPKSFLFTAGIEAKKRKLHNDQPLITSRIIGGDSISIEDAPYQCSLQKIKIHICGCAIIKPNWIITAAHCVFEENVQ